MKKQLIVIVIALMFGLVIGSMATYHSFPPDQAIKIRLLGKGEDLGVVPILVEKRGTGGMASLLITNEEKEPVIAIITDRDGAKEKAMAHLIRKEGGTLELVYVD